MSAIRLATRRSALALAQSRWVAARIEAALGAPVELVEVTTRGDVDPAPLARIGGTGVFVAAVRQAVIDGAADLAVHSLKDLPTAADPHLTLAAVPTREDPRDALVGRDGARLADLPAGARVGTGSPRRRAQLAAARPDLQVVDLRGNVDSRLGRVLGADGPDALDAVLLAVAGLVRLGREGAITQVLEPGMMLPAPGQGALAIEVRTDPADAGRAARGALLDALAGLDDAATRAAVTAERSLLAALGAGCSAPVGALAREAREPARHDPARHDPARHEHEPALHLQAVVARTDGSLVHMSTTGPAGLAEEVGRQLAGALLVDLAPAHEGGRIP